MYERSELERLKKEFEELQLRVTRFSAVEQELINMRDRLDHELDMYKRLHVFNNSALREMSGHEFVRLLADAIIDVFEVETAAVLLDRKAEYGGSLVYFEGMIFEGASRERLVYDITGLTSNSKRNKSRIFDRNDLQGFPSFDGFQEGMLTYVLDDESEFTIHLIGLNSIKNAPLYDIRNRSNLTIFDIFAQQVMSLQSNRQKRKRIGQQMLQIQASDRELKKLSLIATKTKNGVIITDNHGRIEWVNDSFTRTSGWTLEEVKGRKPKDFLHGPNTDPAVISELSSALRQKQNIEVAVMNYDKNGGTYFNLLEITPVFDENGEHINFIALQKDITEEMQFRQEIIRVNSRFEIITTKSGIGIYEWRPDIRKLVWSDVMYQQYGTTLEEAGDNLSDFWLKQIAPEDRDRLRLEVEMMMAGKQDSVEIEYQMRRFDNGDLRTVRCLMVVEKDDTGKILRIIGASEDVTEIRRFEKDIMLKNEELKKINAELDNFVYSISHDLRSPLLSIKGILALVSSAPELSTKNKEFIKLADTSADRLDNTIQEILDYSRNARLELKVTEFDIREMIDGTISDLRFSCPENMRFEVTLEGMTKMTSDQYRVNTVIKNIIGNAVKYHRENIPDPYVNVHMRNEAGVVTFTISDNGSGIPEKNLEKVFEMFFRGTSKVSGTGLGLYICKEIVNKLGGDIRIDSKVDVGTTVNITIPNVPL